MINFYILIILEMAAFLMAMTLTNRDIMAPSVVMCMMFLLSTVFATLRANAWNIKLGSDTLLIIAIGLCVFFIVETAYRAAFIRRYQGKEELYDTDLYIESRVLILIICFDIFICYLYLRSIFAAVGGSLSRVSDYFVAYRRLSILSLQSDGDSLISGPINMGVKILEGTGYLSCYMLAQAILKKDKLSIKIQYAIIMGLSVLPSIMHGGRSGVLKILSAFVIYYYIIWHQKNGWSKNLSWKYVKYGIVGFAVLCPVFYYSLGFLGRETTSTFQDYISDYLGGSICLLDMYVKEPVYVNSFGEESLYGIKKLLSYIGLGEASTSYNLEFRKLGLGRSNVYTFFRRPLHDFGPIGMYIFVAMIAIFFAWIYFRHIKYQDSQKCRIWVLAYGYLFYWMICSSIEQYSANYLSVGAITNIATIIILYKITVKETRT